LLQPANSSLFVHTTFISIRFQLFCFLPNFFPSLHIRILIHPNVLFRPRSFPCKWRCSSASHRHVNGSSKWIRSLRCFAVSYRLVVVCLRRCCRISPTITVRRVVVFLCLLIPIHHTSNLLSRSNDVRDAVLLIYGWWLFEYELWLWLSEGVGQ